MASLVLRASRNRRVAAVALNASRALSWESLGRKVESDGDLKGDYASLKNSWDSVEKDFATWSGPVKPIDWAKYGKQIEVAGFVDFMKAKYEGIDWNSFSTKVSEAEVSADQSEKEAILKEGASIVAAAGQLIETTKARLHLMESKKTDRDTTVDEVWEKYPQIKEEVEKEIEEHQWFKDTK